MHGANAPLIHATARLYVNPTAVIIEYHPWVSIAQHC